MTNKDGARTREDKYGKDYHAKIGAKGGSTPTKKLKGWAYLKAHDPERFLALSKQNKKKGVA